MPLVAAIGLSAAPAANAEAFCSAVPSDVLTQNDGMVIVLTTYRGWIGVCNIKSAWKGVDTQVCWNWFATVSNAVTQRKALVLYYSSLAQADCQTMDTYERSPAPYYVRITG